MQVHDATDVLAERASIEAEIDGQTLLDALARTTERTPDAEALRWKQGDRWLSMTWRQYCEAVTEVAAGLRSIGFQRGDFALIQSRNRPECMISDLGVLAAGGAPVIIYNTLPAEQVEYIANHCEATVALLEDSDFLARFDLIRSRLSHLRHIVMFEIGSDPDASTLTLNTLRARGRGELERGLPPLGPGPDDLATLIYTSGTTGPPKAVMHTHRAALYGVASLRRLAPLETYGPGLSYLPLAHIAARVTNCWLPLVTGTTVAFCPDPALVPQYLLEVRPGAFFGVPRVWEKLQSGLTAALRAEADATKREAVQAALAAGQEAVRLRQRGHPIPGPIGEGAERAKQIGGVLLGKLGLDRAQLGVSGGAPVDPAILDFFTALSLPMIDVWGMTEVMVGTTCRAADARSGTVGKAVPGIELAVADDGELLLRGPVVMKGYYRDPVETSATVEAGWLHTGDIATIDGDGYVRIVDRKKELIITAGGKNMSPANIEHCLKAHPLIGQACAIGDRRPYVTALLVLDPEIAPAWARGQGIETASLAELSTDPQVVAEVCRGVAEANQHLARVEQIKRFRLLPTEWTPESGELTPTLKLRRRIITERYAGDIEALYSNDREPATHQLVRPGGGGAWR